MTDHIEKALAIFLAFIMIISIVGMTAAFAGSAAAGVIDYDNTSVDDVDVGQESVKQTVSTEVQTDGNTITVTIDPTYTNIADGDVIDVSVSVYGSLIKGEDATINDGTIEVNVTGNGNLTAEITYNTTAIPTGTNGVYLSNAGDDILHIWHFNLTAPDSITVAPDNGNTLQYAVNNVDVGGTVTVQDGYYDEQVAVDTNYITLESANGAELTQINAADSNHALDVTADNVTIDGFTVAAADNTTAIDVRNTSTDSTFTVQNSVIEMNGSGGNVWGIHANDVTLTVESNTFTSAGDTLEGVDVVFGSEAKNNHFYLNTFENGANFFHLGENTTPKKNYWNTSRQLTYSYDGNEYTGRMGNYHSNYDGKDTDGDGIGETPHEVNEKNIDYYPLVEKPELYSLGHIPSIVGDKPPQDPDGDGKYEDVNGDETVDGRDVLALWNNRDTLSTKYFDFNGDNSVDARDVLWLWNHRDQL